MYIFAYPNKHDMQKFLFFIRLICAYLIAMVLTPIAFICKMFRK